MPLPVKAFKNKSPEQSADIANAKLKKLQVSCEKKVAAAQSEAEAVADATIGQALTQGGAAVVSDMGLEAIFLKSKKAAKHELGISIAATAAFGALAAVSAATTGGGYLTGGLIGAAQSSASRAGRKVLRSQLG